MGCVVWQLRVAAAVLHAWRYRDCASMQYADCACTAIFLRRLVEFAPRSQYLQFLIPNCIYYSLPPCSRQPAEPAVGARQRLRME